MFKKNPVLKTSLVLTIIIEIILAILTYNAVGMERLPIQIGRMIVQLLFIFSILFNNRKGLLVLVGYHIIVGLMGLYSSDDNHLIVSSLGIYHLTIGIIIYFHDYIEDKIFKIDPNEN